MMCYKRFKRLRMVAVTLVILYVCIYKVYYENNSSNILGNKTEEHYPQDLLDAVEYIRKDCGELCATSATGVKGPYFDQITVPIDCQALFENEHIDRGHGLSIAPKTIPKYLLMDFTMNNRLKVTSWYFNEAYLGKTAKCLCGQNK